jgi:ankyrin repeat protein
MESGAIEEYAEHVGDVVQWSGLVSTSLSQRVAARFGNVLFVIHAANCACIADAAAHRRESEVLLLPSSFFVIVRVTHDSSGGAEIELRDVYTDPDLARPLTPEEARRMALRELQERFGADRAELLIDQATGVGLVSIFLGQLPDMMEENIGRSVSDFLAESAAYRANPGRDDELRARRRAVALRRLREDPEALFAAATRAKPNEMRLVIAAHAALDVVDEHGRTAAMMAAEKGNWQALRLLIDAGADVTVSRDRMGRTTLHYAAGCGRVKAVRLLLGTGVDPDAWDSEGWTALALGAHTNRPAVVEILLRAGAAVDAGMVREGRWLTPLHLAAFQGNAEVVRILLSAGANPSSSRRSDEAFSPLEAAIYNRKAFVARLLVEAGADLEAKGLSGLSVPDLAAVWARRDPSFQEAAILLRRAASGGFF